MQSIGVTAAGNIIALAFVLALYRATIHEGQGREPSLKSLAVIIATLAFLALVFFTAR